MAQPVKTAQRCATAVFWWVLSNATNGLRDAQPASELDSDVFQILSPCFAARRRRIWRRARWPALSISVSAQQRASRRVSRISVRQRLSYVPPL